jgi:hypothetical protein
LGTFYLDDDEGVQPNGDGSDGTDQPRCITFTVAVNQSYSVTENAEPYWTLGNITYTGDGGNVTVDIPNRQASIYVYPNGNITVTFVNEKPMPTRTQGFWKTHTQFTLDVFNNYLSGNMTIGNRTTGKYIEISGPTGNATLLGAYCANNAKTSTGAKRTQIDQARMILLKQLVTAKLNCAAFGCSAEIQAMIAAADNNYSVGTKEQILASANALDIYNNSGDTLIISPPLPWPGPATPKLSCGPGGIGNAAAWNDPSPTWNP